MLGEPGVIGIDESVDLLLERDVGPRHVEDAADEPAAGAAALCAASPNRRS